jgi:hypothetical protein
MARGVPSEKIRAAHARRREVHAEQSDLRDAERDFVFAASQLERGRHVSAFLNAALGLVRLGKHLSDRDYDELQRAVASLRVTVQEGD